MILLNGKKVDFKTFPNGELLLKKEEVHPKLQNHISLKYENDSDLIKLLILKKYLKQDSALTIYYMPYSRMDRSEEGSPFTLKYISDFINELGFTSVEIVEPHSDVTPALINNSHSNYINFKLIHKVINETKFNPENDYLFFPDAGAAKRYSKMKYPHLVGYKERDFSTGEIKSLKLVGDMPERKFKAIIVDDLSSYGGTFIKSAMKLREAGASEVYLLVAHAENSIFEGDIFKTELINKVFTTDSLLTKQNDWNNKKHEDRLRVYKIEEEIN
ncbi:ribose-phosphate pyrophosphokinase [Bacillus sp. FSL M8-0350]|uniref:ribose-phosphate pyrophosphokinase n=1 Tax=Bacillus sp. FSL M8-0350 TaxID=2954579 RepID=UPI00315AB54A